MFGNNQKVFGKIFKEVKMEEFFFWLSLLIKFIKKLFPFIIGAFLGLLAFRMVGKPSGAIGVFCFLFITLMVGIELMKIFRELFK